MIDNPQEDDDLAARADEARDARPFEENEARPHRDTAPLKKVTILSPADVKPGSVAPHGGVVAKTTLYVNDAAGTSIMDVEYVDGTKDALFWPLGNGWIVDGRTA